MPTCGKCRVTKAWMEFYKNKRARNGLQSECKVCQRYQTKTWQAANRERNRQCTIAWKAANPQRNMVMHRTWTRIRNAMKGREHPPPLQMLGCSYEHLMAHLGEIKDGDSIDHIIPIARYNLDDPVDLMRAFNWHNTQLMPLGENSSKHTALPPNVLELKPVWPNSWWGPECDEYFSSSTIDELRDRSAVGVARGEP